MLFETELELLILTKSKQKYLKMEPKPNQNKNQLLNSSIQDQQCLYVATRRMVFAIMSATSHLLTDGKPFAIYGHHCCVQTVSLCVCSIGASLHIYRTSLRNLDLRSLTSIRNGGVLIKSNPQLCFVDTVHWELIQSSPRQKLLVTDNANASQCGTCFTFYMVM